MIDEMDDRKTQLSESSDIGTQRGAWYSAARFGIFIHWGLYSIPAGIWKGVRSGRNDYAEWIQMQGDWPRGIPLAEYRLLADRFNPADFDADAWVKEIANAGAGYIVLTSKHHDGFALWPSRASPYNVLDSTPFGRDIVGEIKNACDKHGIRLGLYYSHWLDWEHPYGGRPHEEEFQSEPLWEQPSQEEFDIYWNEKCLAQVTELIDRYDPSLFWFDTWAENSSPWINEKRLDQLVGLIRTKSPNCLINSRIGTWAHPMGSSLVDIISMGDNEIPEIAPKELWESGVTMRNSWGDHELDFQWKSTKTLIQNLIRCSAHGGNYQLNIGPKADGSLSAPELRRLREIGAWLGANGAAIYGTEPAPFPQQTWGEITMRRRSDGARDLYIHPSNTPVAGPLTVEGCKNLPSSAKVLETGQPVDTRSDGDRLTLALPVEIGAIDLPVVAVTVT